MHAINFRTVRCDRCDGTEHLEHLTEDDWTGLLVCRECVTDLAPLWYRAEPEINPDR